MGTINFVLVGARNTGKTCYLAVLASHCPGISTASDETTAYLKTQRQLLDAGELPQATASTLRELQFRYSGGAHKVDFSIDDYDGSFIESLSRSNTEDDDSRNALKERIQESEGLLFFMPYETRHDEEALSSFEDEINTIISLVEEITQGKYLSLPIPVAVCVPKWDRSPAFQQENEIDAAIVYINETPCYQRAYAKITKLFKQVSVHPISAFGMTTDGAHPIKGKIDPYHLEAPLEFCLNKTFNRFDERIKIFQDNHDELGLFEYLHDLYDDLKHHHEGKSCHVYDEMEQNISKRLLEEINQDKQTTLNNEQINWFKNIRQGALRAKIDQSLQGHASGKRTKKLLIGIMAVALFGGGSYGIIHYQQGMHEKQAFTDLSSTIKNKEIPISEIIPNAQSFLHQWKGFTKDERFSQDRKKIIVSMNDEIHVRLNGLMNSAKKGSTPDSGLIENIKQFKISVDTWLDSDVVSSSDEQLNMVLDSYHMLETLRKAHSRASTMNLEQFKKLKLQVSNAPIQWDNFTKILDQIYLSIATHIKSAANAALASNDLRDLEVSAEALEALSVNGDEEAIQLLKDKIQPALHNAKRQERLATMITSIESERDPQTIAQTVRDNWIPYYSNEGKQHIKLVLQKKFTAYELQEIPALIPLNSRDEMKTVQVKLKKISDATGYVLALEDDTGTFEFRYLRSQNVAIKIKHWDAKLNQYDRYLTSLLAKITFRGDGSDDDATDPLGFNCSANDHDLEITIDGSVNLPDDDKLHSACSNNSIHWNQSVPLRKGMHNIDAIEYDITVFNDEWHGQFQLTESDIFQFVNTGSVTIHVGASYDIILSKN